MKCLLLFQETSPALKNSMLCVWNGDYQLYFFFTIFIDRCSKLSYWQKETSTHIFRLWFDWWKCARRPSSSESNFAFFVCLFVCLFVCEFCFVLFCFILFENQLIPNTCYYVGIESYFSFTWFSLFLILCMHSKLVVISKESSVVFFFSRNALSNFSFHVISPF